MQQVTESGGEPGVVTVYGSCSVKLSAASSKAGSKTVQALKAKLSRLQRLLAGTSLNATGRSEMEASASALAAAITEK